MLQRSVVRPGLRVRLVVATVWPAAILTFYLYYQLSPRWEKLLMLVGR